MPVIFRNIFGNLETANREYMKYNSLIRQHEKLKNIKQKRKE